MSASPVVLIYHTLPLFSGILAHFFLNEYVTLNHFYSQLFILSGIVTVDGVEKRHIVVFFKAVGLTLDVGIIIM